MEWNHWLGLAPALAISVLEWSRVILVLNRYIGFCRATRAQLIALTLFVAGGYVQWVAELTLLHDNMFGLQIVASLCRTVFNWVGSIIIINECLVLTRQQITSPRLSAA